MTTNEQQSLSPDAGRSEQPKDPLAVFRRLPVGLIVFLGLIGAGGLAMFLVNNGKDVVARCGADVMLPGELCETRSRRSLSTTTWTYAERLELAEAQNLGAVMAGLLVVAFAAIAIVAVLVRWRHDTAVAARLANEQAPLTAFADTTGVGVGFATVVAAVLGGFGAFLAFSASGGKGTPEVGLILGGVLALGSVAILWVGRPKGCTLVWAYPSVVRVVTRSTVHDVAWQDMQYLSTIGENRSEWLSWTGRKSSLGVSDNEFAAVMRRTINSAVAPGVQARFDAGELVEFGDVKVSSSTLVLKRRTVPAGTIRGISLKRDKTGTYYEFRDGKGEVAESVMVQSVANADVLFDLLATRLNIGFLAP